MAAAITLYGIPNCDTIKKARRWLDDNGVDYAFHDYRKQGADADMLAGMASSLGWEAMLNRRGTTWRKLPEATKSNIDEASALSLMQENPAIIKRPILARNDALHLGFSDAQYTEIFG